MLELCLKIMLYNRKFIHLQCVFHSIRLRLRLTKIGCRETINFFCTCPPKNYKPLFRFNRKLTGIVRVYSLPYISNSVLRHVTRHGRGEVEVFHFLPCFDFKCDTPQCYSCGNIRGVVRLKFECKGKKRVSQTNFIKERAVSLLETEFDTALPF